LQQLSPLDETQKTSSYGAEGTLRREARARRVPIMNRSESPARTLMFSSSRVPAVSIYPDSNKIGVWPGNDADDLVVQARNGGAVVPRGGRMGQNTLTRSRTRKPAGLTAID
jgi:hypothetical protein